MHKTRKEYEKFVVETFSLSFTVQKRYKRSTLSIVSLSLSLGEEEEEKTKTKLERGGREMRSARSRNVPSNSTARDNENIENWDAESNHHHHRNDDDEKKYFGDGKKHRYVRYMLNVPMKLGTKRLVALSLVVVLVVLFGLNGMMMMGGGGEGNVATMGLSLIHI